MSRTPLPLVILILVLSVLLMPPLSNGQTQGIPWYTVPLPVPNGLVDAVSGNVHLEIPLGSMPQRNGDPIVSKMVYDTVYYTPLVINGSAYWNGYGAGWGSVIGNSRGPGGGAFSSSVESCSQAGFSNYPNGQVNFWSNFQTTDINRTTHSLTVGQPGPPASGSMSTMQVNCYDQYGHPYGSGSDVTYINNGASADGSGYTFQVTNYSQLIIHGPDGTLITDTTGDGLANDPMPVDTNGNTRSSAPNLSSGLPGCSSGTSSVTTSSGASASYTCTTTNLSVSSVVNGTTYVGTESFLTSITLPDGTSWSFTYDTGTTGNHYGTLLSITLPSGGAVSFTYTLTGTGWPSPMKAQTVAYGGGTWSLSYVQSNCSSTCTSKTTVTAPPRYDSASGTNISDNAAFTSTVNTLEFLLQTAQYYSGSSTLLRTVTFTPDNMLPSTVTTTLNDIGQSSSVYYQYSRFGREYPTQIQETDFNGTIVRTKKIAYGFYSKPASVNVYAGDGSSGSPIASTLYTYDEYGASFCKNGVPMLASFTGAYGHDDAHFGTSNTARGNVTTIQRLISGTTYATTHMCYDTLGNVTQVVDANGNPTSYDYSENWADTYCIPSGTVTHSFPTTITDALGYRSKTSYFTCDVLPQSSKDENDIRAGRNGTTYTYDILNRPLVTTYADGGQTSNSYPNATTITTTKAMGSQNLQTTTIFDNLGRSIQTQLTDLAGTDYTDATYDALGRVATVSNPHRTAASPTDGTTTYAYDALGRITQVTHPDNSTILNTYAGRSTQVQDEGNGNQRVTRIAQTDALGRTVSLCEVTSVTLIGGTSGTPTACGLDIARTGFLTTYQYDALNNLRQVNQGGLSARTFTYDSLSRLTSASNPESGAITYAYDANGNLSTKTAPAPNQTGSATVVTTYSYDALNRLTQKSYSDGTPKAIYNHDETAPWGWTLSNPIGHVTTTYTKNSSGGTVTSTLDSYDPLGRVAVREQCQPLSCGSAPNLALTYVYNLLGEPTSIHASQTGVFDFTLSYSYNSTAHLATITSSLNDANHPATLFSGASYDAPALLTTGLLGGVVSEHRSYSSRLRPTSVTIDPSVYSYSMTSYASDGDVLGVNDSVNGNWVYKYDDFNRLVCSNLASNGTCAAPTSGTPTYSYAYDRFGNRWQQNGPQSMRLSFSASNNRMVGYPYDSAGNLLNDGNYAYTYDAENRIIQVNLPGGALVATYMYDANGNRVSKTSGGVSRGYLYDAEGHAVSEINLNSPPATWTRGEIFAAGHHIATYANGTTYFIETDWLGTERVRTNLSGAPCETITSLPFGDGQTTSGSCGDPTPLHFTGKERDSESGLDNFVARYDSSSLGRFMSPDPIGGHNEDPQTLNRYAYVRNNPLNLTDPTGLDFYLQCTDKDHNGCVQVQTDSKNQNSTYWVQADKNRNATIITSDSIRAGDNSAAVSENGVVINGKDQGIYFDNAASHTTDANGNDVNNNPITLAGSGEAFKGFSFTINGNCSGTCLSSGTWTFDANSNMGILSLLSQRGGFTKLGEDAVAFLGYGAHPRSNQIRFGGPLDSPHLSIPYDYPGTMPMDPTTTIPRSGTFHTDEHSNWKHDIDVVTKAPWWPF